MVGAGVISAGLSVSTFLDASHISVNPPQHIALNLVLLLVGFSKQKAGAEMDQMHAATRFSLNNPPAIADVFKKQSKQQSITLF
jgi:hypothetical protein